MYKRFQELLIFNNKDSILQTELGSLFQQILSSLKLNGDFTSNKLAHNQLLFNYLIDIFHLNCELLLEMISIKLTEQSVISSAPSSMIYNIGKGAVLEYLSMINLSNDDIQCISKYCNNRKFCKIVCLPYEINEIVSSIEKKKKGKSRK